MRATTTTLADFAADDETDERKKNKLDKLEWKGRSGKTKKNQKVFVAHSSVTATTSLSLFFFQISNRLTFVIDET